MFAHKVVVRLERKGHGGKTVTVVEGVLAAARDDVQTTLKKRLGTGARAEGDDVIVQGDVVERTAVLLTELGARVVVGTKR